MTDRGRQTEADRLTDRLADRLTQQADPHTLTDTQTDSSCFEAKASVSVQTEYCPVMVPWVFPSAALRPANSPASLGTKALLFWDG